MRPIAVRRRNPPEAAVIDRQGDEREREEVERPGPQRRTFTGHRVRIEARLRRVTPLPFIV